ncbi:MAG: sulfate adenylyltransferase subunit 1 [Acidobacteriota bacterium]|nr:sulfate adenylyltransferase subunit 1 [Acidobacteriota bacterium]
MTLDLLRFTTAGSVDDGKSTLIGRLLYDTKQVFEDQLEHVIQASERRGGEGRLDLSLLTDGLRAEREQGITIDVAYRYFATARRRFIIADTPGHVQYTRNMVTGASTADLAVILVDARAGVVEQSRRHAFIASLLGIPHMVMAVNKMDLVDHSQERFDQIASELREFSRQLRPDIDIRYVPLSALNGDNVVERSVRMDWYEGPTLLELLESVEVAYDHPDETPARFPVQWVVRPSAAIEAHANGKAPAEPAAPAGGSAGGTRSAGQGDPDYRGYAGQVASGALRVGDEVLVLPAQKRSRIAAIDVFEGSLEEALAPMSVTVRLEDDIDISRGDTIVSPDAPPALVRELEADLCWLAEEPLRAGGRYLLKHTTRQVRAVVDLLCDRVEVHTLERSQGPESLELNDIGLVRLRVSEPLAVDPYEVNRSTGCFILIDEATNGTVGAGMIRAQP